MNLAKTNVPPATGLRAMIQPVGLACVSHGVLDLPLVQQQSIQTRPTEPEDSRLSRKPAADARS